MTTRLMPATRRALVLDRLMQFPQQVKSFVTSDTGRRWLARIAFPLLGTLLFVASTHLYTAWSTGRIGENFLRRTAATFALGAIVFGPAVRWRVRRQLAYLAIASLLLGVLVVANAVYS